MRHTFDMPVSVCMMSDCDIFMKFSWWVLGWYRWESGYRWKIYSCGFRKDISGYKLRLIKWLSAVRTALCTSRVYALYTSGSIRVRKSSIVYRNVLYMWVKKLCNCLFICILGLVYIIHVEHEFLYIFLCSIICEYHNFLLLRHAYYILYSSKHRPQTNLSNVRL